MYGCESYVAGLPFAAAAFAIERTKVCFTTERGAVPPTVVRRGCRWHW